MGPTRFRLRSTEAANEFSLTAEQTLHKSNADVVSRLLEEGSRNRCMKAQLSRPSPPFLPQVVESVPLLLGTPSQFLGLSLSLLPIFVALSSVLFASACLQNGDICYPNSDHGSENDCMNCCSGYMDIVDISSPSGVGISHDLSSNVDRSFPF